MLNCFLCPLGLCEEPFALGICKWHLANGYVAKLGQKLGLQIAFGTPWHFAKAWPALGIITSLCL